MRHNISFKKIKLDDEQEEDKHIMKKMNMNRCEEEEVKNECIFTNIFNFFFFNVVLRLRIFLSCLSHAPLHTSDQIFLALHAYLLFYFSLLSQRQDASVTTKKSACRTKVATNSSIIERNEMTTM